MSVNSQDVRASMVHQPGTVPVNDEQLHHIVAVLNDVRSDHLLPDGSRTGPPTEPGQADLTTLATRRAGA